MKPLIQDFERLESVKMLLSPLSTAASRQRLAREWLGGIPAGDIGVDIGEKVAYCIE